MSFINHMAKEINCKVVYYGPGLCGKTTNLQFIYKRTKPEAKGKMISLATETERTLFFDFLPLALGEIRGFKTRFHLYTVPGQVFYDASRKLILKGVDGVVFVADSQEERMDANIESLENLRYNLQEQGYDLDKLPYVVQYNKRDLPNIVSLDELRTELNPTSVPEFEACATTGEGVFETLKAVYIDHLGGGKVELPIKADTYDPYSSFYHVRTLPLEVGKSVYVSILDTNQLWNVEVQVLKKEKLKTILGEVNTILIKPLMTSEGIFERKGEIYIWLTDDARRIPVKMRTKVTIGSVTATLVGGNFSRPE